MKCPNCGAEMAPFSMGFLNLDYCDECSGIWFDKGELAFYTESPDDVPDIETALAEGEPSERVSPRAEGIVLVEAEYIPGSGLMIDICPESHGVFLDKGELKKVEALASKHASLSKVRDAVADLRRRGYQVM